MIPRGRFAVPATAVLGQDLERRLPITVKRRRSEAIPSPKATGSRRVHRAHLSRVVQRRNDAGLITSQSGRSPFRERPFSFGSTYVTRAIRCSAAAIGSRHMALDASKPMPAQAASAEPVKPFPAFRLEGDRHAVDDHHGRRIRSRDRACCRADRLHGTIGGRGRAGHAYRSHRKLGSSTRRRF